MTDSEHSAGVAAEKPGSGPFGRWLLAGMEAMPHGACLVNTGGHVIYANERALGILGIERVDPGAGRPLHELLGADHAPDEWLQPGVSCEHLLRTKSGTLVHARAEPLDTGPAEEPGWLLCLSAPGADDEMDALRERWSLVAEQSMLGLGIVQEESIVYCNAALAGLLGRTCEELVGQSLETCAQMIHPADRDFVLAQARRKSSAEANVLKNYSFRAIRPCGEERYLELFSRSVTYAGRPADLMCVVDVTRRERATQELSRCRGHLEELVRERAEQVRRATEDRFHGERAELVARLISSVSHELRNPLGTIHASLYALAERMRETEAPVDDILQRVQRSIQRCNTLVKQMGEFCRPPRLVKSSTEVDAWLRRLVPQLCGEAALHLDLQSGATVQLDRRRMRRAIEALCENALQAAEPEEEAEITVRTRRNGTKTYIMVEDCGPGMDAETARHALEPLYSTRSTRLGLGLPLARMVAQRHGGRLSIETSEGEGACVTICLPVARRE